MCFHLLNTVCTSRQGRLLVFASVILWEASSIRAGYRKHLEPHLSAGWTGELFFSMNHVVTKFSPSLCSAASPPWDTHRPAFSSGPVLPFSVLWLPPPSPLSWPSSVIPPPPPQVPTISLTLGCTGKTCDLEFTPIAGTACLWGWPHHMQLTDFIAPGKQPCCPSYYRRREQCNAAVVYVERGKWKIFLCFHTPPIAARGCRRCIKQQCALLLGCVIPCYTLWCRQRKESRSTDQLLPLILPALSLTTGTFLEEGVDKS